MVTLGWISNNMVPPYISRTIQDGFTSKFNMLASPHCVDTHVYVDYRFLMVFCEQNDIGGRMNDCNP